LKSASISSGSNERKSDKKVITDDHKEQDFWQKIKMKSDHSRNLDTQQMNQHKYKIYSSGECDIDDMPGKYLAKTSEKIKNKAKTKESNNDNIRPSFLNQSNFKKIIFKNSNLSRGRSKKSDQLSNRNSSGDVGGNDDATKQGTTMKQKKNPHQTIKFNKKKIHIVRSTSQNPKRSRSLSNNVKVSTSKHSDESGNNKEEVYDETSSLGNKKVSKNEITTKWHNNASNIEKIAALASISKYNNTGNFNPGDFQGSAIIRSGNANQNMNNYKESYIRNQQIAKQESANPISPVSTKSTLEGNTSQKIKDKLVATSDAKSNILSMTIKNNDSIANKNSGSIEANSYHSLLSHQSKSFSSTKQNEKSMNNIINSKSIVTKKSKDGINTKGLAKADIKIATKDEMSSSDGFKNKRLNMAKIKPDNPWETNFQSDFIKVFNEDKILKNSSCQPNAYEECLIVAESPGIPASIQKGQGWNQYNEGAQKNSMIRNNIDFGDREYILRAASASDKNHRENKVMSPWSTNCNFDEEGMNLNSFSCRTIEGNILSKKVSLNNKQDNQHFNKIDKIEYNPEFKDSNKQIMAAFKRYSKNENMISAKFQKNKKNLSYSSNDDNEKSTNTKKRNSVSGNESSIQNSIKRKQKVSQITRDKMRSISSASSVKSFQSIK